MTSKALTWIAVIATIAALAAPNIFPSTRNPAPRWVFLRALLLTICVPSSWLTGTFTPSTSPTGFARSALLMCRKTGGPRIHCPYLCSSCRRQAKLLN